MPRVSVIIPVHNAMPHLPECLDSILHQTLDDIEVLCVDDGSTDESLSVLRKHAEKDSRITVLEQANGGAGAARNKGLERATGEYLSFLDSDDFFEPTMLEEAYGKCVADSADIGIYRARYYNDDTGKFAPAEGLLKLDLVPQKTPFSYKDMPDHVLYFVSPAPWTKLFRRAFVLEQGLRFQEIARANDFLFTKLSLVAAERITTIDKVLVSYRVGIKSNLQTSNHRTPLEFHKAHVALRDALIERGVLGEVERGFVNTALSGSLYNLHSLKTLDSFRLLYSKLSDEYFDELGISGRPPEYFYSEQQYEQLQKIMAMSADDYLFDELRGYKTELSATRAKLKKSNAKLAKTKAKLDHIKQSRAYRLGQRLTGIGRRLRRGVSTDPNEG